MDWDAPGALGALAPCGPPGPFRGSAPPAFVAGRAAEPDDAGTEPFARSLAGSCVDEEGAEPVGDADFGFKGSLEAPVDGSEPLGVFAPPVVSLAAVLGGTSDWGGSLPDAAGAPTDEVFASVSGVPVMAFLTAFAFSLLSFLVGSVIPPSLNFGTERSLYPYTVTRKAVCLGGKNLPASTWGLFIYSCDGLDHGGLSGVGDHQDAFPRNRAGLVRDCLTEAECA